MNKDMTQTCSATDSIKSNDATVHNNDMSELSGAIELVMAQIEMSLKESNQSINKLVNAMESTAVNVHSIKQQLADIDYKPVTKQGASTNGIKNNKTSQETIHGLCVQIDNSISTAVNAFQFYDRFTQRLAHIQENLQGIADIVRSSDDKHTVLWQKMHEKIHTVYTLEQEQKLAKKFNSRTTSKQNSDKASENNTSNYGEIQLF